MAGQDVMKIQKVREDSMKMCSLDILRRGVLCVHPNLRRHLNIFREI
jgi:hypothetical protein